MARRSHEKKAAKKKTKKTSSKRTPRTGVEDRTEAGADPVITIHFGEYGEILKQIEHLAKKETRTPELQILHLLKQSLNPSQKGVEGGS
jgi:hypothetical protein